MKSSPVNERTSDKAPESARIERYRKLVRQLPVTMRPGLNQQLTRWELLFPFEQQQAERFLCNVQSFPPESLDSLTRSLRNLEEKMGVGKWDFAQDGDTMSNASMLARSPYYAEWRAEIERVFAKIDQVGANNPSPDAEPNRLIVLILPETLPIAPLTAWKQWGEAGLEFKINGNSQRLCEILLQGKGPDGFPALLAKQTGADSANLWLIDAQTTLHTLLPPQIPASSLSYAALKPLREKFLAEVNTVPKDLKGADQILAGIRHKDWNDLWPSQFEHPRLRNFVIELFLSGNGALIFSNSFVEWAACEALRRARPKVLVARFGMRSKPKPFTSVAIFENQQHISALPDVDDPENSAVDAMALARYTWLAVKRYSEYKSACTVCISENGNCAYAITPTGELPFHGSEGSVDVEEVGKWMVDRL